MSLSRFERMVGIPEDEYHQIRSSQLHTDPVQRKFASLSDEYKKQDLIRNPHIRVQRQGETLNEMINLKDELRSRLTQVTPKPYRTRAQSLFQHVANRILLNEKGELYDADGKLIEASNISDLIQHAVRDRRRNIVPVGWSTFLNILQDNNTPRMILNYDTLHEMQTGKLVTKPTTPAKFVPKKQTEKLVTKTVLAAQTIPRRPSKRLKKSPDYYVKKEKRSRYL